MQFEREKFRGMVFCIIFVSPKGLKYVLVKAIGKAVGATPLSKVFRHLKGSRPPYFLEAHLRASEKSLSRVPTKI